MKKQILVLVMILLTSLLHAGDFALVQDGKAPEEILIDAQAPTCVKYAAAELGDYLQKICGNRPSLVLMNAQWKLPAAKARRIFIGVNAYARQVELKIESLKPDGFIIHADEQNLVIIGRDEPIPYLENKKAITGLGYEDLFVNEKAKLCALGQTGSLFGVYHLLEKFAAVRWIWPGDLGEEVPQAKEVKVAAGRFQVEPSFELRLYYGFKFSEDLPAAQWYRRAGFGGTTDPMWPNHSAQLIYGNPENFKKHPEWFAIHNGVRHPMDLCWSEPTLVDEWVRLAREFFKKNPEAKMFSVMPEDGTGICECARCQARVDWSPPHDAPIDGNALLGNIFWPTINEIARRVHKELPSKMIGTCAYGNYLKPPFLAPKIEPNVVVMFCAMTPTMWAGSGYEAPMESFEKGWWERGIASYCNWEYLDHHVFVVNGFYTPTVIPHLLGKRYKRLKGKSRGVFIEAENLPGLAMHSLSHYGMDHVNWYIMSKLTWDPEANVDAVLDDYCQSFFGPAAKSMRRFWNIQETQWANRPEQLEWNELPTRWNHAYTPKAMREMFQALSEAHQLASSAPEKRYLQRIQLIEGEYAILRSCLVDEWKKNSTSSPLAENGSFEKINQSLPADWSGTEGCQIAEDEKLSGKYSVKLEGNAAILCGKTLQLKKDRDYRVAVWFKTKGNGNPDLVSASPRLSVVSPDLSSKISMTEASVGNGMVVPSNPLTSSIARPGNCSDWQRLYVIFKPGDQVQIRLQGAQGYTCWFDDVTLEELPINWERPAYGFPAY